MSLLDELPAGRWDIGYFAETFLGITLHPGQIRFAESVILRNQTGWRAAYLTICASAGNRAGKTLIMAIVILHSCVYKLNKRPPDWDNDSSVRSWMREPYDWYHFGIQQEVAELVHAELSKVFESRHEAQNGKTCPLIDELGEEIVRWDKKFRGDYAWIVLNEMLGGAEIHFRSTTEKALGSLGKSMHGVSMDECGFEPNLGFVINEVFQFRRLSTGGQLFLISTPSEGFNAFADEWAKGDPQNPLRQSSHMSLRISTRENVGFGIDEDIFNSLLQSTPPELIPQNIDGEFIQGTKSFFNASAVDACFVQSEREDEAPYLPVRALPKKEHRYVQGIDPALTWDNTFSIVLDHTERNRVTGVHISKLSGKQKTISVVALAHDNHAAYAVNGANCITAVDVTGFGGKMMREELSGIPNLRGVEFGGTAKTKLKLLMDVKSMIEQGQIRFPRSGLWLQLRHQLLAYRLQDRKIEQDAVMALAIAVKIVVRTPPGAVSSSLPFSYFEPEQPEPKYREDKYWASLRRRGVVQKIGITNT